MTRHEPVDTQFRLCAPDIQNLTFSGPTDAIAFDFRYCSGDV